MIRTRFMVELGEVLRVGDAKVTTVERYRTTNEFGVEIGYDICEVELAPHLIRVFHSNGSSYAVPIRTVYDANTNTNHVLVWKVEVLNE